MYCVVKCCFYYGKTSGTYGYHRILKDCRDWCFLLLDMAVKFNTVFQSHFFNILTDNAVCLLFIWRDAPEQHLLSVVEQLQSAALEATVIVGATAVAALLRMVFGLHKCFTILSISQGLGHGWQDGWWLLNWWCNPGYHPGICLTGLCKATRNLTIIVVPPPRLEPVNFQVQAHRATNLLWVLRLNRLRSLNFQFPYQPEWRAAWHTYHCPHYNSQSVGFDYTNNNEKHLVTCYRWKSSSVWCYF